MALVPFRVSGPAASQQLDSQLLQVGPYSLLLHQRPKDSGNTAHLRKQQRQQQQQKHGEEPELDGMPQQDMQDRLSHVGLVLWQSGFVLADFLLLRLPQLQRPGSGSSSSWAGVRVLELGCGGGTVGMFLALAGAQVVLTDQEHILSLTRENLHINFPATPAAATASGSSQQSCQGTWGQRAPRVQTAAALGSATAAAGDQVAAADGCTSSPLGAADKSPNGALAASSSVTEQQTPSQQQPQQEQEEQRQPCKQTCWDVFGPGPLVVEHVWGEPQQLLHGRVAAAAAHRLAQGGTGRHCRADEGAAGAAAANAQQGASEWDLLLQQLARADYDVIVGADLLYDPSCHQLLLDSLHALCAAHTQVYLCYRCRGLGEQQFEGLAAAAGWLVQVANSSLLHPEFQGGEYRLLCLSRLG